MVVYVINSSMSLWLSNNPEPERWIDKHYLARRMEEDSNERDFYYSSLLFGDETKWAIFL